MKKFIVLILILLSIKSFSQIHCVFFSDVPPIHRVIILTELNKMCRIQLNDSITSVEIKFINPCFCGVFSGYNAIDHLKFLDSKKRTISITYKKLSEDCNDIQVDGLTLGLNSVITIYNIGLYRRLYKVAMHELGHTYGLLKHCKSRGCFMEAGGTVNQLRMYDREYHFCKKCKSQIKK